MVSPSTPLLSLQPLRGSRDWSKLLPDRGFQIQQLLQKLQGLVHRQIVIAQDRNDPLPIGLVGLGPELLIKHPGFVDDIA